MDLEKYTYVEALRWLANKYNIEIEETAMSPEVKLQQQTSDSLYIINNFAQQFFTNALFNTEEGQDVAMSYLKERGFREDIIRKFQLGYNPAARDAFTNAAIDARYNAELLVRTGLVNNRDEKLQDNYRERIIFPIHNPTGKIAGFGARLIRKNDRAPKYINTPENEVYVKSRLLYGSYFARMAIDKADECLLVEGYTDVVSLHQAGIENVVASGGTALTTDQLRLVKKYCNNLTIIYDGDSAGIKAALRGLDLALDERLNVKLVLIPDNEDPDSYVNKIGAAAFKNFINENKKDFIIFQLEASLADAGNDSAKKSKLVNQVAETIGRINRAEDFTKRQDYIRQVCEILKIDEGGLHNLVNKILRDKINKEESKAVAQPASTDTQNTEAELPDADADLFQNKDEQNERAMIRSLLEFGLKEWSESQSAAEYMFQEIELNDLDQLMQNPALLEILQLYRTWYIQGISPTDKNFMYLENRDIAELVSKVMQSDTDISPNWKNKYEGHIATREELFKDEIISSLNYLKLRKIRRLILDNQQEMQHATTREEQTIFLQTHQHLKQMEIALTSGVGTVIMK